MLGLQAMLEDETSRKAGWNAAEVQTNLNARQTDMHQDKSVQTVSHEYMPTHTHTTNTSYHGWNLSPFISSLLMTLS